MMMDQFHMIIGETVADTGGSPALVSSDDDPGKGPLRRCIVTREVLSKENLIRFVVGPDDSIVPDLQGKLPGRGLWVKADRATLEAATSRNMFAKAAGRPIAVSRDLVDRVAEALRRRCLDLIGLARRAGQAVAGFERVRAELLRQNAGVLLAAVDGSEDGRRKLKGQASGVPIIALFISAELSGALGRENVVHAAVMSGRLAELLVCECGRLAGLCGTPE